MKNKILILFTSILFIISLLGFSYGYFLAYQNGESKTNLVTSAKLIIDFKDVDILNLQNAEPIDETDELMGNNIEFNINGSSNTIEGCYSLFISVDEISDNLKSEYVKWTLYNVNTEEVVSSGNFQNFNGTDINLLNGNEVLFKTTNDKYKLYINLINSETVDQSNLLGGTIRVAVKGKSKNKGCNLKVADQIQIDNTPKSDSTIDFAQPSSVTNGRGLYYTENNITYGEDGQRIYYFRGAVNNNWVSFGGYLWRIVRTTSEKGVKLAYSGNASGTSSAFISTSTGFNPIYTSKYYIGYTYNLSGYSGTQTNSTIKTVIDNWYNANLSSYAGYLSDTAIYCNDRSNERIEGSNIYYPARDRLYTNKRPSYECSSTNSSRYTVSTQTGNGYLQKPIALLTADELDYAGIVYNSPTSLDSYITENATSNLWWTMSPSGWHSSSALVFGESSLGSFNSYTASYTYGVRSSVSLKSCVTVSGGNGSKSAPYTLSNSTCI